MNRRKIENFKFISGNILVNFLCKVLLTNSSFLVNERSLYLFISIVFVTFHSHKITHSIQIWNNNWSRVSTAACCHYNRNSHTKLLCLIFEWSSVQYGSSGRRLFSDRPRGLGCSSDKCNPHCTVSVIVIIFSCLLCNTFLDCILSFII